MMLKDEVVEDDWDDEEFLEGPDKQAVVHQDLVEVVAVERKEYEVERLLRQHNLIEPSRPLVFMVLGSTVAEWLPEWLLDQLLPRQWKGDEIAADDDEAEGVEDGAGQRVNIRIAALTPGEQVELEESPWKVVAVLVRPIATYIATRRSFHFFFSSLVILNAGVLGYYVDSDWSKETKYMVDNIFLFFFFVEVVVRRLALNKSKSEEHLLTLDSIIVAIDVLSAWILPLVGSVQGQFHWVTAFRMIRIVRLVRLVRFVKGLAPLRIFESSLHFAAEYFVCYTIGYFMLCYTMALLLKALLDSSEDSRGSMPTDYFRNVVTSTIYLFDMLMGGVAWSTDMTDQLMDSSPAAGVVIGIIAYLGKICIVNIIAGVHCEVYVWAASEDAKAQVRNDLHKTLSLRRMRALLDLSDVNLDGRISVREFWRIIKHKVYGPEICRLLGIPRDLTKKHAANVFRVLNVNAEESISYDAFLYGYVKLRATSRNIQVLLKDIKLKHLHEITEFPAAFNKLDTHLMHVDERIQTTFGDVQQLRVQVEDSCTTFDNSLGRLEAKFEEVRIALQTGTSPEVKKLLQAPVGASGVASLHLREEMERLQHAARVFFELSHTAV